MELFKNSVGRPSNETLKKRRNFYIFVTLLIIAVIGGGFLYLKNALSNLDFGSASKNIQSGIKGDVASDIVSTTWDGKITSADSTYILKYSINMGKPSAAQKKRADIDGDGKISPEDARIITRMATDGNSTAYGDVNKDGKHTQDDVDLIVAFATGKKKPTSEQKELADVNGDGKITSRDAKQGVKITTDAMIVYDFVHYGYGDVVTAEKYTKSDGKLTKVDAQAILKIAAGNLKPTEAQKQLADYDKDGKITATDSRKILEYLDEDDDVLRETVTVKFDTNGAKTISKNVLTCKISTVKGKESCDIKLPTITPQPGYTVVGWNTTKNARIAKINTGGTTKISSNTTFYSITRKTNPLKLTLNKADASSIGTPSVACNLYNTEKTCNVIMPTITAKTGYLVLGWSKDINGKKSPIISINQAISIAENATYYAITNNLQHKITDASLRKCVLDLYNNKYKTKKVDLSDAEINKIDKANCDEKKAQETVDTVQTEVNSSGFKVLKYDIVGLSTEIGSQSISECHYYSLAYGSYILLNNKKPSLVKNSVPTVVANDSSQFGGCFVDSLYEKNCSVDLPTNLNYSTEYEVIVKKIDKGIPVVIHTKNSSSEHWVLVVGYNNQKKSITNNGTELLKNIWIIDPYGDYGYNNRSRLLWHGIAYSRYTCQSMYNANYRTWDYKTSAK